MAKSKAYINSQLVNQKPPFGQDLDTSTSQVFSYYAGSYYNSDTNELVTVPAGTVSFTLGVSVIKWVLYRPSTNTVLSPTGGTWPGQVGDLPLWKITYNGTKITEIEDLRSDVQYPDLPDESFVYVENADITYTLPFNGITTIQGFMNYMKNRSIAPGVTVTFVTPNGHTEPNTVVWSHPQSDQIVWTGSVAPAGTSTITITPASISGKKAFFYVAPGNTLKLGSNYISIVTSYTTGVSTLPLFKADYATIDTAAGGLYFGGVYASVSNRHDDLVFNNCKVYGSFNRSNSITHNASFTKCQLFVSSWTSLDPTFTDCNGYISNMTVTSDTSGVFTNSDVAISATATVTTAPVLTITNSNIRLSLSGITFSTGSTNISAISVTNSKLHISSSGTLQFGTFTGTRLVNSSASIIHANFSGATFTGTHSSQYIIYGTNSTALASFVGTFTVINKTNLTGDSNGIDLSDVHQIPPGGTQYQALKKASATDFDVSWEDINEVPLPDLGDVGKSLVATGVSTFDWVQTNIPTGGATNAVLAKNSGTNYDFSWTNTVYSTTPALTDDSLLTATTEWVWDAIVRGQRKYITLTNYGAWTPSEISGWTANVSLASTIPKYNDLTFPPVSTGIFIVDNQQPSPELPAAPSVTVDGVTFAATTSASGQITYEVEILVSGVVTLNFAYQQGDAYVIDSNSWGINVAIDDPSNVPPLNTALAYTYVPSATRTFASATNSYTPNRMTMTLVPTIVKATFTNKPDPSTEIVLRFGPTGHYNFQGGSTGGGVFNIAAATFRIENLRA